MNAVARHSMTRRSSDGCIEFYSHFNPMTKEQIREAKKTFRLWRDKLPEVLIKEQGLLCDTAIDALERVEELENRLENYICGNCS